MRSGHALSRKEKHAISRVDQLPIDYLSDASAMVLASFELGRLGRGSNLARELREILFQSIQNQAEALFARWVREHGRGVLAVRRQAPKKYKPSQLARKKDELDTIALSLAREALDGPGAILEPWFQIREVSDKIESLKSVPLRRKWAVYYAKWGCVFCKKQETPHESNGMCHGCRSMLNMRLQEVVRSLQG